MTDAIDRLRVDGILDPCLDHAYESHRAQEDERRKDHEREEAEVVQRSASLKDKRKCDEARGEAAQVDRGSTQTLGDRSGTGAL